MFIRKTDYEKQIQTDDLDTITESDDTLLDTAELTAIEEIKSMIQHRFDVALIFQIYADYVPATSYSIGDIIFVVAENLYYQSLTDANVGNTPASSPSEWVVIVDPRNPMIVTTTVDLALYHLHSRINPRNIPELRGIRRDDANKWLMGVRDFKNNPTLPTLTGDEGVEGLAIKHGSETKRTNGY